MLFASVGGNFRLDGFTRIMICIPPRDTSPHQDGTAQPPAAHRRRHSRPHHSRHGEHSPTARQPHSNGLCSPPKEGPGPGSALRHVDAGPSTQGADAHIVPNGTPARSSLTKHLLCCRPWNAICVCGRKLPRRWGRRRCRASGRSTKPLAPPPIKYDYYYMVYLYIRYIYKYLTRI